MRNFNQEKPFYKKRDSPDFCFYKSNYNEIKQRQAGDFMGTTALILAGGKSSRFGSDKSLLMLHKKLIVQHLVDCCTHFADEVFIISNHKNKFGIDGIYEICDCYQSMGPLGGIHAGLRTSANEKIFVTACDMPFFQISLAEKMLQLLDVYDAVIPCFQNQYEPLFSAMRRDAALPVAENMLRKNQKRMMQMFTQLHTYAWSCTEQEHKNFYNINYKEDYKQLLLQKYESRWVL